MATRPAQKKGKVAQSQPGRAGMSDAAVAAKTGKTWSEWVRLLDAAGAQKMTHQQIVAYVSKHHGVGPWWQQMVTVGYEKLSGKRQTHERPDGYQISASRTFGVNVGKAYVLFATPTYLKRCLPEVEITLTSTTKNKYVRGRSGKDGTRLEINFYPKGVSKCQVSIQQSKLKNAAAGDRMKSFWKQRLAALAQQLE